MSEELEPSAEGSMVESIPEELQVPPLHLLTSVDGLHPVLYRPDGKGVESDGLLRKELGILREQMRQLVMAVGEGVQWERVQSHPMWSAFCQAYLALHTGWTGGRVIPVETMGYPDRLRVRGVVLTDLCPAKTEYRSVLVQYRNTENGPRLYGVVLGSPKYQGDLEDRNPEGDPGFLMQYVPESEFRFSPTSVTFRSYDSRDRRGKPVFRGWVARRRRTN